MATYEVRVELNGYTLTTEIEIDQENPSEQDIYNEILDQIIIEWDEV
jgi:hypothetical protein